MAFVKRFLGYIIAALAVIGAMMAANRATKAKEKAQQAHLDAEELRVSDSIDSAKKALTEAKFHDAEAEKHKIAARNKIDRIAEQNESAADVLDRWKQSNRLRNRQS
jgi:maltose-binding protein MalE